MIELQAEFSGIICVSGGASTTDPTITINNITNGQRYNSAGSLKWN